MTHLENLRYKYSFHSFDILNYTDLKCFLFLAERVTESGNTDVIVFESCSRAYKTLNQFVLYPGITATSATFLQHHAGF